MNSRTQRGILMLGMLGAGLVCAARTAPPTRISASPLAAAASPRVPAAGPVIEPAAPETAPATGDGVERVQVPTSGPRRGPESAQVTIVEFSDFQCPFCSRVVPTLARLQKEYPKQIRLFFHHFPLPFHANAPLAAEAAVAAEAQGKFWEMHDKLFANQQDLTRPALESYAQQIGLDLPRFRAALDGHAGKGRVDADLALGHQVGIEGTPNFFVNGRSVQGAQPYQEFKRVIEDEIVRADHLLAQGTALDQIYPTLLRGAQARIPGPPPRIFDAGPEVYRVPLGDAPARGGVEPKVIIVEFSDFQCPFCGRVNVTLDQLLRDYGQDLAILYRHNPLPFHQNAMPAALAAEAARVQGKFWPMHDKLFANQMNLDRPSLQKYAQEIGLDLKRFDQAMEAGQGKDRIRADMEEAVRFGARGTPSFFINGRSYVGAQPIEGFKKVINDELNKANGKLAAGTPRAGLYAALTKDGLEKKEVPPPAPEPGEPDPAARYRAEIQGAPTKGGKDAPVTIVEWADFQCPFCARAEATLAEIMAAYGDQVRLVWRDQPLPFHDHALPAALAARAAGAQGKFWAMHDKLYADQQRLDPATFEKYAGELGLDLTRFKAAFDSKKLKAAIGADAAAGKKIGAMGTPAFFINGKFLSGAQPFEAFQGKIDAELENAHRLAAGGTPKSHLYQVIMKQARAEVVAADDADDPAAEKGPELDQTVYQIDPTNAPSKGPKDAPLQVVVFSDFQCPFCGRVEPTLSRMQKEYGGQVRLVWKNYPLPFHENAAPAAEAALAAEAQGKFWEMHDKLFADQQHLDRATYEKYAGELGLDLPRFKSDLDSARFKDRIDADRRAADAVGVIGTPSVFINGRKIAGAYPWETFKQIADAELAKRKVARRKP
jgi:protein-disulfide isomerase